MTNLLRTSTVAALLGLALALPNVASAQNGPSGGPTGNNRDFGRSHAPEFDPTVVGAITAIIAGGTVLLARRRKS